jgi:glycosyltransferase involved in cell wall biosynthesis
VTRRIRVAYLLTQDRGGPVDVTVRLASTLIEGDDAEVRVFSPVPSRDAALLDGHHEEISVSSKGSVSDSRRARKLLRAWRPDVVHAQDRRAGLVSAGLHRTRGGPRAVVHTYHGVPDDVEQTWFRGTSNGPTPSRYTRLVLAADAMVARSVSRTIVPAAAMGEFLRRRLRVPAAKLVQIDNCVALPDDVVPAGTVRELIFVGLLVERKGILNLLDALAMPGVMPRDASLTVVGDGPQRGVAEQAAADSALAGRVRFLGFREDVPNLLRRADALVLPSTMEQQPLVVAEAMAAGKLIVATRTGGVPDMVDVAGTRGYLAAPGDIGGLAEQLCAVFADHDPARAGQLLAAHARDRFSPATCARRHLALYSDLVHA